jgi:hypothetical protein
MDLSDISKLRDNLKAGLEEVKTVWPYLFLLVGGAAFVTAIELVDKPQLWHEAFGVVPRFTMLDHVTLWTSAGLICVVLTMLSVGGRINARLKIQGDTDVERHAQELARERAEAQARITELEKDRDGWRTECQRQQAANLSDARNEENRELRRRILFLGREKRDSNGKNAHPDWELYSKQATVEVWEAVVMMFEQDPEQIPEARKGDGALYQIAPKEGETRLRNFLAEYLNTADSAVGVTLVCVETRDVAGCKLTSRVTLREFVRWAAKQDGWRVPWHLRETADLSPADG